MPSTSTSTLTAKRPPVWNTGLIRPERTRAQKEQDLPPSSPRTPTIGERGLRAGDRWASIEWWAKCACLFWALVIGVSVGQCRYLITCALETLIELAYDGVRRLFFVFVTLFWPFGSVQRCAHCVSAVWFLWSVREFWSPLGVGGGGGKVGRALVRFRRWWVENRGRTGEGGGGEEEEEEEEEEEAPTTKTKKINRVEPMPPQDGWNQKGVFQATRYSPERASAIDAEEVAAIRSRPSTPGIGRLVVIDSAPATAKSASMPTYASREVPTSASDPLQPVLRNLALKISSLRTDCIAIWTCYHRLERSKLPIRIEQASQKLLQQAAALENMFEATFNVNPRPPRIHYVTKLADMERDLDDALGLVQLLRQTLDVDVENPSGVTLRRVRNSLAGIARGIAEVQGTRWKGTDAGVGDLRRQRVRLLIPDFAAEDEHMARLAEALRIQEKGQRDWAKKEAAEKRKAERERIAAMSPMDSTEDNTIPPPAVKPSDLPPTGTTYRDLRLKGPVEYVQALQMRLSQGFLPTLTSGEDLMCGLRAIIISLESMGRLSRGHVTPEDILRKMFLAPAEMDPMHDFEASPAGPRGIPSTIYQRFLDHRKKDGYMAGDGWSKDVMSLRNFSSDQLSYVLRLVNDFGLEASGTYFPLGIVTAGSKDTAASVQILYADDMPHNPHNVVWVFNDGNELHSGNGPGIGHWSGFARHTTDRRQWLEEVGKWGLQIPDAVEPPADSKKLETSEI